MAVSILLAIILPASLIAGSFATADTAASEPSAADTAAPAALGGTGGGGRQTPRVAKQNSGISSSKATSLSTPTTPESPLASPSPLATSSPLPTSSPLHSTPENTRNIGNTAHNLPQTRSNTQYTVTFSNPQGSNTTQTITDGERAIRPTDPTKDGYLFDGWFIGNTSVAYDFNQPVTGNLTLTAKWTKGAGTWGISPDHGPETGNTKITITPPAAQGLRFGQISAGNSHSLAIGSDGNLYSWGSNQNGQLGRNIGSATYDAKPGLVAKPAGVSDNFTWVQASAGYDHSLAIGSDGNLYSWGINQYGQLGRSIGSATKDAQPGLVTKPAGTTGSFTWSQASAGGRSSMAIGSNGILYSWGYNQLGQLGNGSRDSQTHIKPGPIKNPSTATGPWSRVSAGYDHALAIGSDGKIYSWGSNNHGQLGNGDSSSYWSTTPVKVQVPDTLTITQISAKSDSSLALTADGSLYTWGWNDNGQIGRGATGSTAFYVNPDKLTVSGVSFTQAGVGRGTTLALGSDGKLYGWGKYGKTPISGAPSQITFTQVSAGDDYLLTVGSDGNLYSWGNNQYGQLGLTDNVGTSTGARTPKPASFPDTATPSSVDFGGTVGTNLTANADGTWSVTTPQHAKGKVDAVIAWSLNGIRPDARLSYTYDGPYTVTFAQGSVNAPVSGIPSNQYVYECSRAKRPYPDPKAAGFLFDGWFLKDAKGESKVAYDFSQPVTADITLVAHWSPTSTGGWSISPSKGNVLGGQRAIITPPRLSRGIRFSQVSAGGFQAGDFQGFSIGVASDGNAYAWGSNQHGQLGQGSTSSTPQKTPIRVPLPDGVASGFTYTQAVAGGYHVLAVGSDGIVYAWGANEHGQLGDSTTTERYKPQPVKGADGQPFKAVQVSAGAFDSAAISPDGRVYTWGSENNNFTAYSTSKLTPTLTKDPNGSGQGLHAAQVSLGWSFIMAMDTDGSLYTWGYNYYGQFGNGTATGGSSTTRATYAADPARVPDPKDTSKAFKAAQVSAGANHALAISQDGALWAWGYNDRGQLGDGSTTSRPTPEQIQDPANPGQAFQAVWVSAGVHHSLAVDRNGAAWAWGWNSDGQLGDNLTDNWYTPTRVLPPAGQGSAGTGFASARISAGRNHSLAVGQDGNTYSWGDNTYGQLGNGSLTQSSTPAPAAFNPKLLITGVKFDKTALNPLQQNSDGSVTLATPAHNPGQADVIVDWTLGGAGQAQVHLAYTYEGVLPLTGGNGSMILLLAAGLLAAAGAVAAGRHRRETRIQYV